MPIRINDSLDQPNAGAAPPAAPLATRPAPRDDWRNIIARGVIYVLGGSVAWLVMPEWAHNYITAVGLGLGTIELGKRALTDTVMGIPVRTWLNRVTSTEIVGYAGRSQEFAAKAELPRGLQAYQSSAPPRQIAAASDDETPEAEVIPDVGPLPPQEWLAWLNVQPHAIFAAKTGGGKSTLAKYGLSPRISAGEMVFIIDPHSNGWFELPGVGGGEDWPMVEAAMMAVYAEYKRRLMYREKHKRETGEELPHDYFPRLTVVFDEANNAQQAFERIYSGAKRRLDPWPLFAQCLGSGARKVNICVWLLLQSALVEDIGLSGAMRQNFTRFALDLETIRQMLNKEKAERRAAIDAALVGEKFPATATIDSEVYLLDRAGLDRPPTPRGSALAAWDGWDYDNNCALVEDAETMPALPEKTVRHVAQSATPAPTQQDPMTRYGAMKFVDDSARIGWLAYHTKLGTREIREIVGCKYNLVVAVAGNVRRLKEAKERVSG